jgi:hypothetical chaperone protein
MPTPLGLDFGTTNTVAARRAADGQVRAVPFRHDNVEATTFRTVLAFWQEQQEHGRETCSEAGPWAIERFLAEPFDTRFVQSFKTFAASRSFTQTTIAGRTFSFEDLLTTFLLRLRTHGRDALGDIGERLVVGRPVAFAGVATDPALARVRYDTALARLGVREVQHVYEPVAAAYWFAQRLERDATVLVGDFGGGTSDFSILHFACTPRGIEARPLGHAGVGIAGDSFDYRIIDHVVAPRLGKGTQTRSWGKTLDMPGHYYANFARWSQLSILKQPRLLGELRQLARESLTPAPLEAFIDLIEADVGFSLYAAVSAAKLELSSRPSARLRFRAGRFQLDETITRSDFERWIAPDLLRIDQAVAAALASANCTPAEIDRVFLTGGSSFVPAVQRRFVDRFGAAKVEGGEQLLSIAYGLALIAADPEPERWTVTAEATAIEAE